MYLLASFFLHKFLKILRTDPECHFRRMCHLQAQNSPFVMTKAFLVQTIIITFIYLLALFIVPNFKKFLQWIQSNEDAPFLGLRWSIFPKQNFVWKIINVSLIYLLTSFIGQNVKKVLPADLELWGCAIFWPKMTHFPKWDSFSENLLVSLVSSIHAYLHAKNPSQILI